MSPAEEREKHGGLFNGRLRACSWCGSLHPEDLAKAIRKGGLRLSFADRKYGWPHKIYVDNMPTPWEGMTISVEGASHRPQNPEGWEEYRSGFNSVTGEPMMSWRKLSLAGPTTWGKFYTVHLQDAEPADKEVIERACGLQFDFTSTPGSVSWSAAPMPNPGD